MKPGTFQLWATSILIVCVGGCSPHHSIVSSTSTASSPASTAPIKPPAAPPSAPSVTTGLVVISQPNGRGPWLEGLIDPASGQYSQVGSFNLNYDMSQIDPMKFSADFLRYATNRQVGSSDHIGWADQNRGFTDINKGESTPSEFGGDPPVYDEIGFDGSGNFFYDRRDAASANPAYFKLPAGHSNATEAVPSDITADYGRFTRNGNGELVSLNSTCSPPNGWLSSNTYVSDGGGGVNIFKEDVTNDNSSNACTHIISTPLLPTTNTSSVRYPRPSPDGTKVAFVRNGTELWLVDTSGSGTPTKVEVKGFDFTADDVLIGWK